MNKIDKVKLECLKNSLTEKDYNDLKNFMERIEKIGKDRE
jgi:hypothetical protein